jgi:uncharacterized membrane protein
MIDLLAVLQEKTKGNLVPDEEQDLSQLVHELRSRFVELSALMAQQAASRGGVGGVGGMGGMGGAGIGGIRPAQ